MSNVPGVGDAEHATETVGLLELRLVHAGGPQHAAPQLYGVRVAHYVQVHTTTRHERHQPIIEELANMFAVEFTSCFFIQGDPFSFYDYKLIFYNVPNE